MHNALFRCNKKEVWVFLVEVHRRATFCIKYIKKQNLIKGFHANEEHFSRLNHREYWNFLPFTPCQFTSPHVFFAYTTQVTHRSNNINSRCVGTSCQHYPIHFHSVVTGRGALSPLLWLNLLSSSESGGNGGKLTLGLAALKYSQTVNKLGFSCYDVMCNGDLKVVNLPSEIGSQPSRYYGPYCKYIIAGRMGIYRAVL